MKFSTLIMGATLVFASHSGFSATLSDVTFNGNNSDAYATIGSNFSNANDATNYANTQNIFGGGWSIGDGVVDGFDFTFVKIPGVYGLFVSETGTNTFNLPAIMDLAIYVPSGSDGDYYFFDDVSVSGISGGTFDLNWEWGSVPVNIGLFTINIPTFLPTTNVDGVSLLVRDIRSSQVPEPMSLALLGIGLLGMGITTRRKVIN